MKDKKTKIGRPRKFQDYDIVVSKTKTNPRRIGTKAHSYFQVILDNGGKISVGEYIKKAGEGPDIMRELHYNIEKDWLFVRAKK